MCIMSFHTLHKPQSAFVSVTALISSFENVSVTVHTTTSPTSSTSEKLLLETNPDVKVMLTLFLSGCFSISRLIKPQKGLFLTAFCLFSSSDCGEDAAGVSASTELEEDAASHLFVCELSVREKIYYSLLLTFRRS